MSRDRILTGLQANERFHLGNYLGAILPMVQLQAHTDKHDLNLFIPDLHSLTLPIDYGKLQGNINSNLGYFAAAGLDFSDKHTFVYRQSHVPAHSELAWILGCFTYFGELRRMTQFKDKGGEDEQVSAGLFTYPSLMAADILLYGAKYVPLGDDQRQHLELTRDLAIRLNNKFGEIFTVPVAWDDQLAFRDLKSGVRIRSLSTPEKKMSKSVQDPRGTIKLDDDPEDAARKVMAATTDSLGNIKLDWENQPGISNLLQILALLTDKPLQEVALAWQNKTQYGELKAATAEAVRDFLTDFQAQLAEVDEKQIMEQVERSEAEMRPVAEATLLKVQQAVGLR